VQSRKYSFKLIIHNRYEHSLYTVSWKNTFADWQHAPQNPMAGERA
jgi:hypothetical protein